MKRILKVILLYSCILIFAGCGKKAHDEGEKEVNSKTIREIQMEKQAEVLGDTMEVEVVNVRSGLLVVDPEYGLCRIKNQENKIIEELSVGDHISIKPCGPMEEDGYPKELATSNVTILEQGIDKFQPLREAIYTMHKTENLPNRQVELITLDLTKLENFSVREKEALTYLVSCDLNFSNMYQSTEQELISNQQIVTSDNGHKYFKNGILYIVEAEDVKDGFVFNIERYTSSNSDCKMENQKATKVKEVYEWKKESEDTKQDKDKEKQK